MSTADATSARRDAGPVSTERRISASDGLELFVRDMRPAGPAAGVPVQTPPLLCLPGLTRDGRDFSALARHAATVERPRRVVSIDFRGRGRSARDADAGKYTVMQEAQDVLDVLTALDIPDAVFVGTSRGGLVTMVVAGMRPGVIAASVLNDVGPEVPVAALIEIREALDRGASPRDCDHAADLMRESYGRQFPGTDRDGWHAMARNIYAEEDGRPVISYDRRILEPLAGLEPDRELPGMWPHFDALATCPLLVVRGENSSVLPADLLERMRARQPGIETLLVSDAGHAPTLATPAEFEALDRFFARL